MANKDMPTLNKLSKLVKKTKQEKYREVRMRQAAFSKVFYVLKTDKTCIPVDQPK